MFNKTNIIIGALVIIVGAGSFFGGMKVGEGNKFNAFGTKNFQNMTDSQRQQLAQQNPTNRIGQNGFGGTFGEVLSKDDKSITVKIPNGGSKIILYSDTTTVVKTINGVASDIEIGQTISVNGTTNTDGSVSAKSIQIQPATTATKTN
jgi:hypothetical protein